jgi:hypothetical protein
MTKPKHVFSRQASNSGTRNLPTPAVCARYDISESTLRRWEQDPLLEFPAGFKVAEHGMNFYNEQALDEFDRHRAERAVVRREERAARRAAEAARIAEEARTEEARTAARRTRRKGGKRAAEAQP